MCKTPENERANRARIAALNDDLRRTGNGGRLYITAGVQALGDEFVQEVNTAVRNFDAFCPDNDPHEEHDFGSVEVSGRKVFFKIDYYDPTLTHGSEDPADPSRTTRVLTIMLAEEY